jgi:hypothetical protein
VASSFRDGRSRRVLCRLNTLDERQCALLPIGNESFVVTVNRTQLKALGLDVGATVRVTLRKDESVYGLPVPQELTELFRQDTEGKRLFHALSRGRQRTLLYIVGKANTPDDRASRAVIVIQHLIENAGVIDYRKLSVRLKQGRNRTAAGFRG